MLKTLQTFGKQLFTPKNRPPGPSSFDIMEQDLGNDPNLLSFVLKASKKYGDLVYIPTFNIYLVTGPKEFEHILKTHHTQYERQASFYFKSMAAFFGNSILVNEGQPWKFRRRMISSFYMQKNMRNFIPDIVETTRHFLSEWNGSKINLHNEMCHLTFAIISKLTCNDEPSREVMFQWEKSLRFCNRYTSKLVLPIRWLPTIGNIRFQWHKKILYKEIMKIINKRRQQPEAQDDLLNLLIRAKHDKEDRLLNDEEVFTELKTHLITGHETTASASAFMLTLLAQHPQYLQWVHEEVDTLLGDRTPAWEDLPKLKKLQAIVLETLRLYPSIWSIPRNCLEDDKFSGFDIPKGAALVLHIYALHRNPRYWDRPDSFYPERFLQPDPDRHPFAFLPFGSGPHQCVATHLAPMEMTIILAMIAQKFTWKLNKKTTIRLDSCMSLRPKNSLIIQPIPRQK